MTRTLLYPFAALAALCHLVAPAARAQTVSVTDLNPPGSTRSEAHAVSGGRQVGFSVNAQGVSHAVVWRGTAASVVDLHPAGFTASAANGAGGGAQAGTGDLPPGADNISHHHALLWTDTAAGAVDLHPDGFGNSYATAVSGNAQVGYAADAATGSPHALLWNGSADSATDLTPPGLSYAVATGVSGSAQVGYGVAANVHALLWHGTAGGVVDLNPAGFSQSFAEGVSGGVQVGQGYNGSRYHALLWSGTAQSAVDLNPAGCAGSSAYAAVSGTQVGVGSVGGSPHALLWRGTAGTALDLNKFLPAGFNTASSASGVDGTSSAVTVVGYGEGSTGRHAFLWHVTFLSVSSLSPASALAGNGAFTLTVNGANFAPSTLVKWNSTELSTHYASSTKLTATVPASLIASAGTAKVSVVTPQVAASGFKTLIINPRPVLSSLSPSIKKAGSGAFTLTAGGTGFLSISLVKWNGAELTTHFVSSTQLTAQVPASLIAAAGKASVTIVTPHVVTSGTKTFTITP